MLERRSTMYNLPEKPMFYLQHRQGERRGAIIVMVAILLVVLLGCVALAVDIGHLYVARTELQRAADAAALAGAQALGRGLDSPLGEYLFANDIYSQAESYAQLNDCTLQAVVLDRNTDIKIGYLANPRDLSATLQIVPLDQCNVVQVIARRSAATAAGEVKLFFAPIWGINSSEVSASAIAVLDDRFYAYKGGDALPFTLLIDTWNDQIIDGNGPDNYGYDKDTGDVTSSPDGVKEVKLFPEKQKKGKGGGSTGAGNFGILHIGSGSLGVPYLREQIRNGISEDDFVDLTGEPMVKFYEYESGDEVNYEIEGNPGIKAGMEDAIEEKHGQVVGFFIHDSISGSGSNAVYHVVAICFGRIMDVDIRGKDKAIMIQPVPYYGQGVLASPNAPSTDKLIARLELVR